MKCPNKTCGFEVPDGETFCDECGTEFTVCANCNTANVLSNKFCLKCGAEIVNDSPAMPASDEPASQLPTPPQASSTEFMENTGGTLILPQS